MSSTALTEEQRRRMEENRQKALQKRAASLALQNQRGASTANPTSSNASYYNGVPPASESKKPYYPPPAPLSSSQVNLPGTTSAAKQFNGAKSTIQTGRSQPVTGTCRLMSPERFLVDIPWSQFNNQINSLFKSVLGNQFDINTKKWSFPISEHENFLRKMECLRPDVYIGGVSSYVLRALRQTGATKRPSEVDLSPIDPALLKTLMPFQAEGVRFGISRNGRVLIADDMGLGKTIQALGIAHYYYSDWPLLIVAPSSMRYAWREAIWNWLPSVNPGSLSVVESSNDNFYSAKVVILSYDLLSKKSDQLEKCKVIIMDESHHLKNNKTVRAKAAIPLLQNAKRAILLSGTPALSRPVELYTQISAINRNIFPGFQEYGIRYCAGKQTAYGWNYTGASNMEELQIVLESTCMIRRLKSEVLAQLPSKIRQMLILDPAIVNAKSKSLKTTAKSYLEHSKVKSMEKRGKLLEYYSETGKAKGEAISAYVKDLVEAGKKFLCFAHHRSVLDGICETLESVKCKYIRIDGSTPSEDRNKLVDMFQYNESVMVAVLSITAANSGITLTAAHLVVFAELFWNPGILTQAEDRAHRIGQMDSVLIQYLVAKDTADDILWPMVQGKLDILNKAGLSKDNFREADASSLIQSNLGSQQKEINSYFKPIPTSGNTSHSAASSKSNVLTNEDVACLEDDGDDELLQLLEESFNDSGDWSTNGEAAASCFKSPDSNWTNRHNRPNR